MNLHAKTCELMFYFIKLIMQRQDIWESIDLEVEFSMIPPTRKLITDPSQYLNDSWLLQGQDLFFFFFMDYFVQKAVLRVGGLCRSVVVWLTSIPEILGRLYPKRWRKKKWKKIQLGCFWGGIHICYYNYGVKPTSSKQWYHRSICPSMVTELKTGVVIWVVL